MSHTQRLAGWPLWLCLFFLRTLNAIFLRTYFDPDEYWQTIEVAHHAIFGYGWLSWEWIIGLRSILSVIPFIAYFQVIQLFALDSDITIASIAASSDYLACKLANRLFKKSSVGDSTLMMMLISTWNLAYSTRTISNNLETLLVLAALQFLPLEWKQKFSWMDLSIGIFLMGLSILNRPSAITHWIVPIILILINLKSIRRMMGFILLSILLGLLVLAFGAGIDAAYYGKFILTWWNFIELNVFNGISSYYGRSPWHYHLLQTIPIMAGTMLPLICISLSSSTHSTQFILKFILGSVFFNSLLAHKEFRFLSPVVPMMMILAGHGYRILPKMAMGRYRLLKRLFLIFILLSNVAFGVYLARFHQSGVIRVIEHLRTEVDRNNVVGVYFVMPCHSTPFYGYLHRNIPLSIVSCHPPVGIPSKTTYLDEGDIFQKDPVAYLKKILTRSISHVVLFQHLLGQPKVQETLNSSSYRECWRTFNSHWNPDERRKGDVIVYCRK